MVDITIDMVLQGIFIGVIIAVLAVGYNKLVLGKFVKALIKAEAVHPAFAKTFNELNLKRNIFLSFALRKNGTLRKVVYQLDNRINDIRDVTNSGNNNTKNNDGNNLNNTNDMFYYYIPEDKLYRAGRIYGGKDVDLLMLAAVIIVFFIFFAILLLYLPNLLNYASEVFNL